MVEPAGRGPAPGGTAVARTVVVLGMHRSGTSVVAGILHALGVDMGPTAPGEGWEGQHWSNPTGHFENPAFVAFNQRALGGDATGIRGPPKWKDLGEHRAEFGPEVRQLLRASERQYWGWKDPWTVLTLELFLAELTNPAFVFVRRPKEEVLASLRRRATARDVELAGLWDLYEARLADLERQLGPYPRHVVLYHDLLRDPRGTIDRLVEWIGVHPTREEFERAFGMVLAGPALARESRRLAIAGLVGFPRWAGWIVKRDLRSRPSVAANDLVSAIPNELFQVLRALL
ncbi:MAG: sulfotransferase [Thermoplasmata archaeon]|nr:sulfotransferase [Thermoplasmata archaeon]